MRELTPMISVVISLFGRGKACSSAGNAGKGKEGWLLRTPSAQLVPCSTTLVKYPTRKCAQEQGDLIRNLEEGCLTCYHNV
eukprot:158811-Pelagomonas_calceolata.AAC.1